MKSTKATTKVTSKATNYARNFAESVDTVVVTKSDDGVKAIVTKSNASGVSAKSNPVSSTNLAVKNSTMNIPDTKLTLDEALKQLDKSGLRPGQTEITESKIMNIVKNYDPIKAQSSIYKDNTGRYLVEGRSSYNSC